jgi:hypothetical protein
MNCAMAPVSASPPPNSASAAASLARWSWIFWSAPDDYLEKNIRLKTANRRGMTKIKEVSQGNIPDPKRSNR